MPHVKKELEALGEKPTAVLLLDNCSAHPDPEDLVSSDGAKFLPPNITSLIQPMDQGVIESLKRRNKSKLLRRLITEDEVGMSAIEFLKGINLKVVTDLVHESWTEVSSSTLRKSWRKILPMTTSAPTSSLKELYSMAVPDEEDLSPAKSDRNETSNCGYGVWQGIRIRIAHSDACTAVPEVNDVPTHEFETLFNELGVEIESDKIDEWLDSDINDSGVHMYSDAEICELVSRGEDSAESDDEESSDDEEVPMISHGDAARFFGLCLTWLKRQPEATVYNTSVLRELQSLAATKRIKCLKQAKLTTYFK